MQAVPLLSPRLRLAVALQAPWCGLACVLGNNIFAISPHYVPSKMVPGIYHCGRKYNDHLISHTETKLTLLFQTV